jgi:hypothetical protein
MDYQNGVRQWMLLCFGEGIAADTAERNHRFLEEALELVQALNCSKADVLQLVDYVFDRPVGEPGQEVGGVMVCLAALCDANRINMKQEGERELARINQFDVLTKIRAKQAKKPKFSALPE